MCMYQTYCLGHGTVFISMILKTDTSSLASRESRNRFGPFPNKIQNNTPLEVNLAGNGPPTIMAETPLVKHIIHIYYSIKLV